MATLGQREVYSHATLDCSDMTLTEYDANGARTFHILEILKRWDGVPNIEIEFRQSCSLPAKEG